MPVESATPVLRSGEYARSRAFLETLGFTCVEEAGTPTGFGIFIRDKARLFVNAYEGADAGPTRVWRGYFHVTEFDALVTDLRARGVEFSTEPHLAVYDMREVEVTDPDGNVLCFGADP